MLRLAFEKDTAFPVVCFQDKPFLFVEYRVDRDTIPEGMHMYEAADGDGDGCFARIQKYVLVNFWGTLIGPEPLDLPDDGAYYPTYGSYEYEGSYGYYKVSEEDDEEYDALTADELREAWEYEPSQFTSDAELADDPCVCLLPGKKYSFEGTLEPHIKTEINNGEISYVPGDPVDEDMLSKFCDLLRENLESEGLKAEVLTVSNNSIHTVFTVGKDAVRAMTVRDIHCDAADEHGINCECSVDSFCLLDDAA